MQEFERLKGSPCVLAREGQVLIINPNGFRWAVISKKALRSLKSSLKENSELASQLKNDGIISDQFSHQEMIKCNRNKPLSIVVLHTTNRCSLDCNYCYSDANSSSKEMSLGTAQKTIERIAEFGSSPMKLEFHGGEPTLRPDFIYEVIKYGNKFRLNDIPLLKYSIQTNGVNISGYLMDIFRENTFSVGISLDGPEEFHNKNRIYPSGKGSFEDVIKTIQNLNSKGVDFSTTCVVSDPSVLDYYPEFMIKNNIRSVKFNPYFEGQGRAHSHEMSEEMQIRYSEKMLALADRLVELNSSGKRKYSVGNLSVLIKNIISPKRDYMCLRFPCGAGISMLGIGVDGEVYSCEEMNGNPALVIGNIYERSISEMLSGERNLKVSSRRLEDIADCGECFAVEVCNVNCANKSYQKSKNLNSKTSMCEYYKNVIPGLMWKIYNNPEIIKCLI